MAANINKTEIEKQAREILGKFAKALERTEKENEVGGFVEREEFERKESVSSFEKSNNNSKNLSCRVDNDFKKKMLDNAPMHDEDFIIAERKEWN